MSVPPPPPPPPPSAPDTEPTLPPELEAALRETDASPVEVPARVDEAVLAGAAARFGRRRPARGRPAWIGGAVAAVTLVAAAAVFGPTLFDRDPGRAEIAARTASEADTLEFTEGAAGGALLAGEPAESFALLGATGPSSTLVGATTHARELLERLGLGSEGDPITDVLAVAVAPWPEDEPAPQAISASPDPRFDAETAAPAALDAESRDTLLGLLVAYESGDGDEDGAALGRRATRAALPALDDGFATGRWSLSVARGAGEAGAVGAWWVAIEAAGDELRVETGGRSVQFTAPPSTTVFLAGAGPWPEGLTVVSDGPAPRIVAVRAVSPEGEPLPAPALSWRAATPEAVE